MLKTVASLDLAVAGFIMRNIKNPLLDRIMSRINRGESLFLILLVYIGWNPPPDWGWMTLHVGVIAFVTDRLILFIKKTAARKRPLVTVVGKTDQNPDMKHSFPSAHAANSMVVVLLLVLVYQFPPVFLVFSIFAGIGRLLTLHHFVSDILGGWALGSFVAFVNFYIYMWFFRYSN